MRSPSRRCYEGSCDNVTSIGTTTVTTGAVPGLRVAAVQLPGCTGRRDHDLAVAVAAVREAASAGARLILLPELALTPYFAALPVGAYREHAEAVPGPLTARFAALARELSITVVLPLFEHDPAGGTWHNSAVVLGPNGAVVPAVDRHDTSRTTVRKLHLPVLGDPPCDEASHFTPGTGLGVHDVAGVRIGVLICYDRRFGECWRELRSLGAQVVLVPIAGSGGEDTEYVIGELRAHARENGLPAVAASKVGPEHVGGTVVDNVGDSTVIDAAGTLLAHRPGSAGPGLALADLDLHGLPALRQRLRFFDHRRPDLFGGPPLDTAVEA